MPKRLLDSSYLNSPSLAKCSAAADDAWPRFILFADDFGCFEVDPRRLAVNGWNSRRVDVTAERITAWLEEYVAAGMAVLWTENERRYCFLTGWFGPHGQRRRVEYDPDSVSGRKGSKRHTPAPPADLVDAVVAGIRRDADGKPPGTSREDASENINSFLPAREYPAPAAGPVVSRPFPAPAVPVAVPDVRTYERTDVLASWRQQLADALCVVGMNPLRIVNGERARVIRSHVEALGVEVAVEVCASAARDAGKVPGTGDWFEPILARAVADPPPPKRGPGECPKPADPDFNDPDAWPDYEAFLARDAGGSHAA
jgi:hypothetical protein